MWSPRGQGGRRGLGKDYGGTGEDQLRPAGQRHFVALSRMVTCH